MLARKWIVYGSIAGIVGDITYALTIAPLELPDQIRLFSAVAFGPLLSMAFVGLYHFFALDRKTVAIQASAIFGVIAGTIANMMLVVQGAIFLSIPEDARAGLGLAWDGLNMVQLGLDVSWDIYLATATVLLGLAMFTHPRFGKIWGALTLAIGAALLALNLLTFPNPPASAGSIDMGPVAGLWYLIVSIRILTSLKWVNQTTVLTEE